MHPAEEIRRAERTDESLEEDDVGAPGAVSGRNVVDAVLLFHFRELAGDRIEGLVPTYPLPLVLTPGADSLKGVLEAVRVIQ